MRPHYNNKIKNMKFNELLPAKNVKTHLNGIITPRKTICERETIHPPMDKWYETIWKNLYIQNYDFNFFFQAVLSYS